MRYKDITGNVYGRITVLKPYGSDSKGQMTWVCECECGERIVRKGCTLRLGKIKSCGCWKKEFAASINKTHGMGKTKINYVWLDMKGRCNNENHKRYKDYGGRGISHDPRWEKFENFYEDMKESYKEGLSLDRIDNEKNYTKGNCRWTDVLTQNNNKRNNVFETVDGITATRSQLADMYKVPRPTFYWRLKRGYTVEEALKGKNKPTNSNNRRN